VVTCKLRVAKMDVFSFASDACHFVSKQCNFSQESNIKAIKHDGLHSVLLSKFGAFNHTLQILLFYRVALI